MIFLTETFFTSNSYSKTLQQCYWYEIFDIAEKEFPCKVCNIKFIKTGNSNLFEMISSTETFFACKICDKNIIQPGNWNWH